MSVSPQIRIEALPPERWPTVRAMYRREAGTLGFLPDGAFEDYAAKRQLLAALAADGTPLGYAIYRVVADRAILVHLCVQREYRSGGIASALVQRLKKDTQHLQGIGLRCRRDYDANSMWPRFGFVAVFAKPGRALDGAELTYWWFSHGHPDLFSSAGDVTQGTRLQVAIDANVFFDIHCRKTVESEESRALTAQWLADDIELCLTSEIHNDIERGEDPIIRKASRALTTQHRIIAPPHARVDEVVSELRALLPASVCLRDEADIRHIAKTIAAGLRFFVTRDEDLLKRHQVLYDRYMLSVVRPSTLVNQLDAIRREDEYRPAFLHGTQHQSRLLKSDDLSISSEVFVSEFEKKGEFQKAIRAYLAHPDEFESTICVSADGKPLVLCIAERARQATRNICILRVSREGLSTTVVRHILCENIRESSRSSVKSITVTDQGVSAPVTAALGEIGFCRVGEGWLRIVEKGLLTDDDVRARISWHAERVADPSFRARLQQAMADYSNSLDPVAAARIEHAIWPGKLSGAPIPCYIVPIRPKWAQHFFDEEPASQLLFGLRTDLHLGLEGVYYRSCHGPTFDVPGRILWYVSRDADGRGPMAIRACSRLDEVVIAEGADLFRRFRRLGIYERHDVIAAGHRDSLHRAMALRFSLTERFATGVPLSWLNSHGIPGNIVGPRPIAPGLFRLVYEEGNGPCHE